MITLDDAFKKFKSRLELTDREQADASRRQTKIRELLREEFDIERDILTGSYARWTKTKPLKDVDIFCIMGASAAHYRKSPPATVLEAFRKTLASEYGTAATEVQRRSVQVDFGVKGVEDDAQGQVMSFDVVPAFAVDRYYEIPDKITGGWIKTDPEVHKQKGVDANEALQQGSRRGVSRKALELRPKRSAVLYTGKMPKSTAIILSLRSGARPHRPAS